MTREEFIDENLYYESGALYWRTKNSQHSPGQLVKGWHQSGRGTPSKLIKCKGMIFSYAQAVFYLNYRVIPQVIRFIDGNNENYNIDNLRPSSNRLINIERGKQLGNYTSNYKGVHWDKQKRKYRANIRRDGKLYHLGYFDHEIDAAEAYNNKAIEFYGSLATLNEVN